ncbi:hypothetical protein CEXT_562871 [Caerostris extrusa]|uniref:Uncharacterized protein n=1 Tax=Caerostris extrusa TaxID=172846 RepID=A0AAV4WN95_CAEEX|nr:hypothetical protein CEXT_562871 [Caerostris extrusa]
MRKLTPNDSVSKRSNRIHKVETLLGDSTTEELTDRDFFGFLNQKKLSDVCIKGIATRKCRSKYGLKKYLLEVKLIESTMKITSSPKYFAKTKCGFIHTDNIKCKVGTVEGTERKSFKEKAQSTNLFAAPSTHLSNSIAKVPLLEFLQIDPVFTTSWRQEHFFFSERSLISIFFFFSSDAFRIHSTFR